jgi:hypothetical protein
MRTVTLPLTEDQADLLDLPAGAASEIRGQV